MHDIGNVRLPSRRSVLTGLGTALIAGSATCGTRIATAARTTPLYLSACRAPHGGHHVAAFTLDGDLLYTTSLPGRGHDIAFRPSRSEAVVFARRPGDWFAVFHSGTGIAHRVVMAAPGRHFYGHGVFSLDGTLLFATENDIRTGQGMLGVYDVTDSYRRVDERPSHGIGPHDVAILPGGRMAIANGGLRTDPAQGRRILNRDDPRPRLTIADAASGEALDAVDLGPHRRMLSIRHLAVAPDGAVAFGCQYVGDPGETPLLVGLLGADGRVVMLDMPEDDLPALDNYIGSVTLDAAGAILCATSPRGGTAAFWDVASRRYLGRRSKPDVCGVAAGGNGLFLLTSGNDGAELLPVSTNGAKRLPPALSAWIWDNHIATV